MLQKTLFGAIMLLSATCLYAQPYRYSKYDWTPFLIQQRPFEYTPGKNVKQMTFHITRQGKTKTYIKQYNPSGKITGYYHIKDDISEPVWKMEYNDANKLTKVETFKKGQLLNTMTYAFNDKGEPLKQEKTNNGNTILYKTVWNYDAAGCLSEYIRYKKGGTHIAKRWVYEYSDSCARSKATEYNARGKIAQIWTYDCNQEGEKLETKKDETQVCKWEKIDSSALIKGYQTFDEKGRIIKSIIKYILPDTLIIEWEKYNEDNELIYKETYDKNEKKPLSREYYRKGRFLSAWKFEYKDDLLVKQTFSLGTKILERTEYVYFPDTLLAELKKYKKRDNLFQVARMEYLK